MADYRIIADVTTELLRLVRETLCPTLLPHPEQIALNAPDSQDNEALLNVYLYGQRECVDYMPERQVSPSGYYSGRPYVLALQYVVYFSRHAQSPLDPMAQQQCIGRLLAFFSRAQTLEPMRFHAAAGAQDQPAAILLPKLDGHYQRALWTGFSEPLRPAVYLEVMPLLLDGIQESQPRTRELEAEVRRK